MDQAGNAAPRFFGYGSLVNRATHDYIDIRRTRVKGWARAWRHTGLRDVAFLTAVPDPTGEIEGLSAAVPNADWAALDAREFAYDRIALKAMDDTMIYAIPDGKHAPASAAHPILLSYLDVVVQGYLNEFGEAGAALFFATTHGWDAPVLDDRCAPLYPRHQLLTREEARFVDDALEALECKVTRV